VRRPAWTASVGLVVVLALAGCGQDVTDAEAAKAKDLQAAVRPIGIDISEGVAASLYGTDGGAVCEDAADPGTLSSEAASVVSHRFALRKTKADRDDVKYLRAVIKTYCPDQLDSFNDYVDGLAVGNPD
jgi:hypothetical protein